MSDGATCSVESAFALRMEVGLVRDPEYARSLCPGPKHRTWDLVRGVNHGVPRDLITTWMRTNRHLLPCIKEGRIRIVE